MTPLLLLPGLFKSSTKAPATPLIMQLRLCSGLNLTEYAARYGVRFDAGQMAFLRHCAASGYAVLDGDTLRLTPSGMIVQNAILEELI